MWVRNAKDYSLSYKIMYGLGQVCILFLLISFFYYFSHPTKEKEAESIPGQAREVIKKSANSFRSYLKGEDEKEQEKLAAASKKCVLCETLRPFIIPLIVVVLIAAFIFREKIVRLIPEKIKSGWDWTKSDPQLPKIKKE